MIEDLIDSIENMKEVEAVDIVNSLLERGTDPLIVLDACREAMSIIGGKFERGESFIPELIMAGEIMRQISEIVKPHLVGEVEVQKAGKVVIGTVQGDIHDIAKDIVVFMLDINGFEVIDLGVDVSSQAFIDKLQEEGASILGLSGFLTMAFEPMKQTIDNLSAADLRDKVKVMIGGGPVDEGVKIYTGADAWGKDAVAAVKIAKAWTEPKDRM
jgi:5-methyltetrahydrofolate--homocysteine methyltransferase